jgi:hypothetical protein
MMATAGASGGEPGQIYEVPAASEVLISLLQQESVGGTPPPTPSRKGRGLEVLHALAVPFDFFTRSKAGIHEHPSRKLRHGPCSWTPAFAGVTQGPFRPLGHFLLRSWIA